jgi:hypothetical protein
MRRRDFLTGAAALAGMTSQAEAFGFGNLGAEFGHMGSVLGKAGTNTAWVLSGAAVDLDFANSRYFGGVAPTCTRNLAAYAKNADLTLTSFAPNVARITNLGLTREGAGTNKLLQSETFQTTWNSTTNIFDPTFSTTTTAPDPTKLAQKLTETTTNATHQVFQATTQTSAALPNVFSVYAKQAERTRIVMYVDTGVSTVGCLACFDLANGNVAFSGGLTTPFTSVSATIEPAGNGFYRCAVFFTTTVTSGLRSQIHLDNGTGQGANGHIYAGTNGWGVYIWGADLKQQSVLDSYVPTTTVTVTRPQDVLALSGTALAIFSGSAASVLAQTANWYNSNALALLQDVTNGNSIVGWDTTPNGTTDWTSGGTLLSAATGVPSRSVTSRVGLATNGAGRSLVVGNATVVTDANALQSSSSVTIGTSDGTFTMSRLTLWNTRLADATLRPLTGDSSFPNTLNIKAAAFPTWRAAVARVLAGSGRGRIAVIGDSSEMGYGAGVGNAVNGARLLSRPAQMASGLAKRGIPTSLDSWTGFGINIGGGGMTYALVPAYDPRMSFGANWSADTASTNAFGGGIIQSSGGTAALVFTPTGTFDTIDVYYFTGVGNSSFDTSIDGGASLGTTSTNATQSIQKVTFTVARGTHAISITPSSTSLLQMQGIRAYDSTTPAVDVLIGAWGGSATAGWVDNSKTITAINGLKYFAPDLTIIELGSNDEEALVSIPTIIANLQTLFNAANISGDVYFAMHYPCNTTNIIAAQAALLAAEQTLAGSTYAFRDLLTQYGSWAAANAKLLMFDNLHGNATQQNQIGDYDADILNYVGRL